MANELNIQLDPFTEQGLTLIAKVFNKAGTQQGSDVAMTESSTGFYTGNFALGSISDGDYIVKFQTTTDFYGSGILSVKDNAEFAPSTLTSAEVATELATYDAPTKAELDAAVSGLSTFDANNDTVSTDTESRNASKADTSALATAASITALNDLSTSDIDARLAAYDAPTKAEIDAGIATIQDNLGTINQGVQKSSILVPHTDNL